MLLNRIYYAVVFVCSVLFVILHGGSIAYTTFYTVLMLPAVTWILAVMSKKGLRVFASFDRNTAVKGEEAQYSVRLENEGFLSLSAVDISLPGFDSFHVTPLKTPVLTVKPKSVLNRDFSFTPLCRGRFYIGGGKITVYDLLGLFRFRASFGKTVEMVVYPQVKEVSGMIVANLSNESSFSRSISFEEDYSSVSDLRSYKPDDSHKRIHWKVSASKNELIVKNFHTSVMNRCLFITDNYNYEDGPSAIEWQDGLVTGMVSLGRMCLSRRFPLDVYFDGGKGPAVFSERDYEGFPRLYQLAAVMEFQGKTEFTAFFDAILRVEGDCTNIFVFTYHLDGEIRDKMKSALAFGHRVTLVYPEKYSRLENSPGFESHLRDLERSGILAVGF